MLETEPFTLPGDERRVLCIHGFTGTPFEVKPVALRLHQEGATVRVMRLPGHGTSLEDLDRRSWTEWTAAVDEEFESLASAGRPVFVVGQSLGGLLSLHLAARHPALLAGISVLATPLWLFPLPTAIIGTLERFPHLVRFARRLPKLNGSDVRDPVTKAQNPSYPAIPVRALLQFNQFMRKVRTELPEVTVPTQVIHARNDHTAPFDSAREIVNRIAASPIEEVVLTRSFHLIAIDLERDLVGEKVASFALRLPSWGER